VIERPMVAIRIVPAAAEEHVRGPGAAAAAEFRVVAGAAALVSKLALESRWKVR
jgi:hypothetical protein